MSGSYGAKVDSDLFQRQMDFDGSEYERRRARLTEEMAAARLDAFLINSKPNHRYFSGHWTGRWNNLTRPVFLVFRPGRAPIIFCSAIEEGMARQTAYECEIRLYGGPGTDLGPPLWELSELLRELGVAGGRIGAELGVYQRPQIPPLGFDVLRAALPGTQFVDGSSMLWRLRVKKSPAEVEYLRESARITNDVLDSAPEWLGKAKTDRDVYFEVARRLLDQGAEAVGYVNVHPEVDGLTAAGYTGRPLKRGNAVYIDAGCFVKGYWSDFCRMYTLGEASSKDQDGYRRLWDLTETCLAAIKPGVPIRIVAAKAYEHAQELTEGKVTPFLGRVGHGLGLDMPEPPSIWLQEQMVLEPGMVLCVEPSLDLPGVGTMIAEETIVVTDKGYELLTRRAPNAMPEV